MSEFVDSIAILSSKHTVPCRTWQETIQQETKKGNHQGRAMKNASLTPHFRKMVVSLQNWTYRFSSNSVLLRLILFCFELLSIRKLC